MNKHNEQSRTQRLIGFISYLVVMSLFCAMAMATMTCPPAPKCYHYKTDWPGCDLGWNCGSAQKCCDGDCRSNCGECCGTGCCNLDLCQRCVGNDHCEVCGGDINQSCCGGTCYDLRQKTCCEGNICGSEGCCEGEIEEGLCYVSRDCGCNPVIGGCSDSTERQPAGGGQIYVAVGTTGPGCRADQGEVPCSMTRGCTEAGYHQFELCTFINPLIPQGYCTAWTWPYCQDCAGYGEWQIQTERSVRCIMP
jgi:hypothetical protein